MKITVKICTSLSADCVNSFHNRLFICNFFSYLFGLFFFIRRLFNGANRKIIRSRRIFRLRHCSTTNSRRKIQIICDRKFSSTTSSPPHPSFERQKDEIENCAVAPVWKKCNTRVSHATNRWIERKVIWVWVARENV